MKQETMLAAVFENAGEAAAVIRPMEVPRPLLGDRDVLVRVEASPVHPADLMFIAGRYRIRPQFPQIAGLEGCGIVVQTDPNTGIAVGARVAFRHPGCWAEYASVPAAKATVVPHGVPAEIAAQYSLNPITAWALLTDCGVTHGGWVALNAAGSSVASLVRALAVAKGVHVVNIYRGVALSHGDSASVSSAVSDLAAAILDRTHGEPIDALLDCVGGDAVMRMLPALKAGGTIVSYGALQGMPAQMGNADLIYRNLTWKGFGIDRWMQANPEVVAQLPELLWARMREGRLPLPIKSRHDLVDVRRALDGSALEGTGKSLVIMPQP